MRNYTRRSNTLLLINDDRRYSSLVLLYIDCTKKNRTKNSFGWRKIRHFCNASIGLSVESSNKLWLLNVQCSKSKEFSSVGKESIEFMIFSWNVCLKIQQIDDSFNIEQINACGRSDSKRFSRAFKWVRVHWKSNSAGAQQYILFSTVDASMSLAQPLKPWQVTCFYMVWLVFNYFWKWLKSAIFPHS